MPIPFLDAIDLALNELQNARIQSLASDPGSPVDGQIWLNTTSGQLKLRRAGATKVLLESGAVVNADIAAGAAIALSKLATDPLARANHTGTQLASTVSNFDTQVRTSTLNQMAAPTAAVPLNAQKITGLADPTLAQDAATKAYVDASRAGLDVKDSVRVASTVNLTLSATQTIDGVAVIVGDRVLAKNQTTGSENGIWVVAAGAWARATDADSSTEVNGGMFVFVEEGTAAADTGWVLSTNNPITLGTTPLVYSQFSAAVALTAGAGLTQTGTTWDVNPDNATLEVNADVLRVKDAGISLSGAKVTGTLPIANGGTAATTAVAARTSLGAVGKYAADITGDASATQFTVTHNLGTMDVLVQVYEATTNGLVFTEVVRVTTNSVRLDFATAPANLKVYRVVVLG